MEADAGEAREAREQEQDMHGGRRTRLVRVQVNCWCNQQGNGDWYLRLPATTCASLLQRAKCEAGLQKSKPAPLTPN